MNVPLLLGVLAAAAYALMSHFLMLHAADAPWAVAALFGPLLLPVLVWSWRQRRGLPRLATGAAVAALVWVVAAGGLGDVHRLYLAQHAGVHLALGASFAWTLGGGREALITALARRVHRVSPDMARYTRGLTQWWVAYFFGMAGLSVAVFLLAPWPVWSLLANLVTPLAIGALFVGEHLLRYRLHPEFERVSLSDMVRAYRGQGPGLPEAGGASRP